MANQKTGGCKKHRRSKHFSSGIRKNRAGKNCKPLNARKLIDPVTRKYIRIDTKIKRMQVDLTKCLTHSQRFNQLPKSVRKKIYGCTIYPQ